MLVAPQTNEWGTKVGLLSGLVAMCAARPILERLLPEPKSAADELRGFAARLATGGGGARHGGSAGAARLGLAVVLVLAIGVGIVAAGAPARLPVFDTAAVLDSVPHQVDPATFPAITIGQDVTDWNHAIEGDRRLRDIVMTMGREPRDREPGRSCAVIECYPPGRSTTAIA